MTPPKNNHLKLSMAMLMAIRDASERDDLQVHAESKTLAAIFQRDLGYWSFGKFFLNDAGLDVADRFDELKQLVPGAAAYWQGVADAQAREQRIRGAA